MAVAEDEHIRGSDPQTVQVGWHPALSEMTGDPLSPRGRVLDHHSLMLEEWRRVVVGGPFRVVLQGVLPESRDCPEERGQDRSRGPRGSSAGPGLPLRLCRRLCVQNLGHVTQRFLLI